MLTATLYSCLSHLDSMTSCSACFVSLSAIHVQYTHYDLCYHSVFLLWSRSSHASNIDPVLNAARRAISEYIRPARVDDLYLLCEIAPHPHISDGQCHPSLRNTNKKGPSASSLYEQDPAKKTLKSSTASSTLLNPLMAAPVLED